MEKLIRFFKDWMLIIAMTMGASAYFVCASIPALQPAGPFVLKAIGWIQPILIFTMLFITFCKVDPRKLSWRPWHGWLLLIQTVAFVVLALALMAFPDIEQRPAIEGAMLCLICPTATAAAVVTSKLGGDAEGLTTYTILINLTAAIVIPIFIPLVNPHPHYGFLASLLLILGQVFPTLICPLFAAMAVRKFLPKFHRLITSQKDLAFRIWAVTLSLAIAMTTRSLVHADIQFARALGIAVASLLCCLAQFGVGRLIGCHYSAPIGAAQALGQKNTVFAIWMGYTFLSPVSSVAGGFYSIWHNVINSLQLKNKSRKELSNKK